MWLQDRLDTFKADFEGRNAPPGVVEVMQQATAALGASRQAARALPSRRLHAGVFRCLTQRGRSFDWRISRARGASILAIRLSTLTIAAN
jgi:hypothetical protein